MGRQRRRSISTKIIGWRPTFGWRLLSKKILSLVGEQVLKLLAGNLLRAGNVFSRVCLLMHWTSSHREPPSSDPPGTGPDCPPRTGTHQTRPNLYI